jgi:putative DNA primase/helicase
MLGGTAGYAKSCDISTLAKKKNSNGSGPSSDICRLKGSRFVIASEPSADFELDEAKVKSLTGNDKITARMLYSNDIEFVATFKIFIATNHKPNIADDSIIDSNRLKVIPFNRHFTPDEQKKNLKERLCFPDVLSALFNKCLQGWSQFNQNGLAEPQAVKNATASYQTSGQILQVYLDTELIQEAGATITLAIYYSTYVAWCVENGFIPMSREKVNNYVRTKGMFKSSATINGKTMRNILIGYRFKTEKDTEYVQIQCPF